MVRYFERRKFAFSSLDLEMEKVGGNICNYIESQITVDKYRSLFKVAINRGGEQAGIKNFFIG